MKINHEKLPEIDALKKMKKGEVMMRNYFNSEIETGVKSFNRKDNNLFKSLMNFPIDEENIYKEAILEYNDPNLKILDKAYDNRGKLLINYKALYNFGKPKELGPFWDIVKKIRENSN